MSSLVLTLWRTWIGRVALATSWWLPHKQRAFVGFLEKEIVKDKIAILDTGENPEAPASREMSDLEVWCHCNLVCAIYRVNLSAYFCVHYIQGDLFGLLLCALYTGWSFRPTFVCTIYRVILSAYFCVHYIQGDLFGLLLCALYTGWSFQPTFDGMYDLNAFVEF